jgi:translation initiation factor 1
VYSTNEYFDYTYEQDTEAETLPPGRQKLYVSLDRKNRKGKEVTLVEGFVGASDDLQELGKKLKSKCGSGGSAKDGEILVQGNHVRKVVDLLIEMGYGQVKTKGGF